MVCPKCKSEMSKKWQARSAGDVAVSSGMVWSCGVCGGQLTMSDLKPYARREQNVEHEATSDLLTLPRPASAVTPWAPRDAKRNGE
jgi:hypothetical protein